MSTTEGVEMSSDDETPSLEKDKKLDEIIQPCPPVSTKQHKCRILRKKKPAEERSVPITSLGNLYEINTGLRPNISDAKLNSNESIDDVESGVEAFEDFNLQPSDALSQNCETNPIDDDVISSLAEQVENLEVDEDNVLNIREVSGIDIQQSWLNNDVKYTHFAPEGFVDLRHVTIEITWFDIIYSYRYIIVLCGILMFYFSISIPIYLNGFITGMLCTLAVIGFYYRFNSLNSLTTSLTDASFPMSIIRSQTVFEVPAVKEYKPITKFEGWMNEYPEPYDPQTYHISQTQSVYVKLQENLLKISHCRSKIPKRAMWNEPVHKVTFTQHRIYNLLAAKITLLPEGLNKKRHWSKKYPICIVLNKNHMNLDFTVNSEIVENKTKNVETNEKQKKPSTKKNISAQTQIFSKLTEEDFELESESSRPTSPSPDISTEAKIFEHEEDDEMDETSKEFEHDDEPLDEEEMSLNGWTTFTPIDSPEETCIYLFGRTSREKEDWFRRFLAATHKGNNSHTNKNCDLDADQPITVPNTLITPENIEADYLKYMGKFQKAQSKMQTEIDHAANVLWVNALLGRVLFDCYRDPIFIDKVKERIEKKLSSIKLPYFIEQLSISELSLGDNPPLIHKVNKPFLDQRGLWVDLDVTYEGVTVLTLQTKLNLMKLKQPPTIETRTIYNSSAKWQSSDVDDTAESSTDDERNFIPTTGKVLDDSGNPVVGLGGSSNTSKKIIKMVDKIAESKFFQAATENRYIKKAMEGVSNTDLSLKVEIKGLIGTLVLNIPPPPSDRIWLGFRPSPKLWLTVQPIVGERNISFIKYLTNWIEKKLSQEFQKVLVIPNMEDLVISVMTSKLPR